MIANTAQSATTRDTLYIMRRREGMANHLQFVGIVTALGGVLGFISSHKSPIAAHLFCTGLALIVIGAICAKGFRSIAQFASRTISKKQTMQQHEFDNHITPRRGAMVGALIAAGSMFALAVSGFEHGSTSIFQGNNAIYGVVAGLAVMTFCALLAYKRDHKSRNSSPNCTNLGPFFEPRGITMGGSLAAGSGLLMMREGMWSAGVNTLLVGVSLMLAGVILDFRSATNNKLKNYEHDDNRTDVTVYGSQQRRFNRTKEKVDLAQRFFAPAGAIIAGGGAINMLHQALSSGNVFSTANISCIVVGSVLTLISLLSAADDQNTLDDTCKSNEYVYKS